MDGKRKRIGAGRWRAAALVATGVALGAAMMATPAVGHVGGTVGHLANHMKTYFFPKKQSDARYANAVAGTDKARDADALDGIDSTGFLRSTEKAKDADTLDGIDSGGFLPAKLYRVNSNYTLGVADPRTNGRKAEVSCDEGDLLVSGGYYTGTVNNPNQYQGSTPTGTNTWRLEWWVPGGGSGGYVAVTATCLDTAPPAHGQ